MLDFISTKFKIIFAIIIVIIIIAVIYTTYYPSIIKNTLKKNDDVCDDDSDDDSDSEDNGKKIIKTKNQKPKINIQEVYQDLSDDFDKGLTEKEFLKRYSEFDPFVYLELKEIHNIARMQQREATVDDYKSAFEDFIDNGN